VSDPGGDRAPLAPPPERRRDAATMIVGILVIIGGVALALPAGFCSALMVPLLAEGSDALDSLGLLILALVVTAAGAFCIWLGCRMVWTGRGVGWGFGIIIGLTILLIVQIMFSLSSM
jgi:hypothetical protein